VHQEQAVQAAALRLFVFLGKAIKYMNLATRKSIEDLQAAAANL
jgi:hypothetical protein